MLDRIEAIQFESDIQPIKINAYDKNMKLVKSWEFLNRTKAWEAFLEIHGEWFEYKKRNKNGVKEISV